MGVYNKNASKHGLLVEFGVPICPAADVNSVISYQ